MCVNDKFSKPLKWYLGEDAIVRESKYCSDVIKEHFNKELVMTKKDDDDFRNSTTCSIFDNVHVNVDVKLIDYCHITGKCGGAAHRYYNIKIKLNNKIPVAHYNLKVLWFTSYYARTRQIWF